MAKSNEKIKKYETAVRSRVECEEKAFHIVNTLIDGKVDESYLIKCGQMISREHYNDVIEERAISLLCGYPLCDNRLTNIPKKQYHISTSTNKVYDISERKNFCSNQCLKASKHYINQISESPLWTRAKEPLVDIKLLPHTGIRGMVGSEVVGISPQKLLEEEIKRLEELDIRSSPSSKKNTQTSESKKMKPSNLKKTTGVVTDDDTKVESLKTSLVDKMEELGIRGDKTDDIVPPQCNINGIKDGKILQSKQTLDDVTAVSVNKESSLLNINTSNERRNESVVLPQEDNLSYKISNNVTTKVHEGKLGKAESMIEKHMPLLNNNVHEASVFDKSKDTAAKMEHLMNLLSKRKAVLSDMIEDVMTESAYSSETTHLPIPKVTSSKEEVVLTVKDADHFTPSQHTSNLNSSQANHTPPSACQNSPKPSTAKPSSKNEKQSSNKKLLPKSQLELIGVILKTWVTSETTAYIQSSLADSREGPVNFSDPRIQRGYADLCQRLDAQQKDFEELLIDTEGSNMDGSAKASKSMPDYDALKKEAEAFQLRVTEFITGKQPQSVHKKEEDDGKDPVHIPTVDAYDQRQIRIKIVLDRLDKFLPDLLAALHLSVQDVCSLVRELVYTFRLEKHNIVFRPSEWTLVAIFVLKMLGKKNKNIARAFSEESAIRHFTILLKGLGHTLADLDIVTEDMLSS